MPTSVCPPTDFWLVLGGFHRHPYKGFHSRRAGAQSRSIGLPLAFPAGPFSGRDPATENVKCWLFWGSGKLEWRLTAASAAPSFDALTRRSAMI